MIDRDGAGAGRGRLLLQACFFLSGFAALVYQTAWTRQFAFVFGTSELAVATVLAAYMAGLAAGAAVAARVASRVRRPVLWYGLLELGIALCALAVPLAVRGVQALYVVLFSTASPSAEPDGIASALFFLACSFAILMLPTGLMGATLPLLARHAVRRESEIGSRIGALYAINTVGAVAGTLLAAFWLLPALGLRGTVWVAAALNILVFAVAALLARLAPAPPAPLDAASPPPAAAGRFILPMILASGSASFTYEVLWTRLLSHAVGSSVYAFATMLASFLVGIAVGSAFASRRAATREMAVRGFAWAQLGTACLSFTSYALLDRLPELARHLEARGGDALLVDVTLAALTLLPSALCIGATFPLAVRIAARGEADAGPASARVYAWNTVGAIAGAIGAGFFLLPWLGFEGTLMAGVATNLLLAGATALFAGTGRSVVFAAAAAGAVFWFLYPGPPWSLLRTEALTRQPGTGRVSFYAVGRGATVIVEDEYGQFRLRTNGLPEATISGHGGRAARGKTSHWLGLLPVLARPELESMLVVGLGGGVALESIPASVARIDVVEIEPQVIAANRLLAPLRRVDPLADPRVTLHANDARNTLLLAHAGTLDAVVAQASHPWTAAASHLYTREFFELVSERLDGDGVLVQWIGLGFVDAGLLRTLVATLLDVFPHVELYQPGGAMGVLFLASRAPLDVLATSARALPRSPELFAALGLATVEDVLAARVLDETAARAFAAGAPVARDDRNLLQMRSPQIRGHGLDLQMAQRLFAKAREKAGSGAVPSGLEPFRVIRSLLEVYDFERALEAVAALSEPAARHAARGLIGLEGGQVELARRELDAALRLDPDSAEARAAALRLRRRAGGAAEVTALSTGTPRALERAVVAGWQAEAREDWEALRASDGLLAEATAGDPLFREAALLRARWRVAAGDADDARAARVLLDSVLARAESPPQMVLRARASLLAGETDAALESLSEVGDLLAQQARAPAANRATLSFMPLDVADQALEILSAMPAGPAGPSDRDLVRARLEALRRRKG